MCECQLCRKAAPKTIVQLAPQIWLDQQEPANIARFSSAPPSKLYELCVVEVGDCCSSFMAAELRAIAPLLLEAAKEPETDAGWLCAIWNMFPNNAQLQRTIVSNPNVPLELAKIAAPRFFDEFRENPASLLWSLASPALRQEIEDEFLQLAQALPYTQRWCLPVSASWLQLLSMSSQEGARCYAASHEGSPAAMRWELSRDPSPKVRSLLAYHADADLLRCLADDLEIDVRREAARVGSCIEVLSTLARDPAFEVRVSVAMNQRVELPLKMRAELRFEKNSWGSSFLAR